MTQASPRQRVLDAARELFYAQGIHATGVDALAARAGVSKRTLYRDFASKDELVRAYLERFGERGEIPAEDVLLDETLPPARRILAAFAALDDVLVATRLRGCPVANAVAELPEPDHPGRRAAVEHKQRLGDRLRHALEQLGHPDPPLAARQLVIVWDGTLAQAATHRSTRPVRDAQAIVEALLAGVRPRPGHSDSSPPA